MADNDVKLSNNHKYTISQKERAVSLLYAKPLCDVVKETGIPKTTLARWKKELNIPTIAPTGTARNAERNEVQKNINIARAENVKQFVDEAWSVTLGSIKELNKRIQRQANALDEIRVLEHFILENREVVLAGETEFTKSVVVELLKKIRDLEVIRTSELATIMGVSYDKYALASGGATGRVSVSFEDMPE